jgi:hypothetical protein
VPPSAPQSPSSPKYSARTEAPAANKAPDDWVTGADRMTAAQASYLQRLCEHAGEAFQARLTKAQASKCIHALRARTPFWSPHESTSVATPSAGRAARGHREAAMD